MRVVAAAALVAALALLALLHGRGRVEGSVVSANGEKVYVARSIERVALRFVDRDRAATRYRVFITRGSTRNELGGRTGERGAASRLVAPALAQPSRVSVRWSVDGRTAGRWVFLVRPSKRNT